MLYVGAGTDIGMVSIFPDTTRFIFIDTLPRSEFDNCTKEDPPQKWYRPGFITELFEECAQHGFILLNTQIYPDRHDKRCSELPYYYPSRLTFHSSDGRTIEYYVSTNLSLPLIIEWEQLRNTLYQMNRIYVCGHFPDRSLLSYLSTPLLCYVAHVAIDDPTTMEHTILEGIFDMDDIQYRNTFAHLFLVQSHTIIPHPKERLLTKGISINADAAFHRQSSIIRQSLSYWKDVSYAPQKKIPLF